MARTNMEHRPLEAPRARIAVIIPCHNEEAAIGTVVRDFHRALPTAEIYVYDNNSVDRTAEIAREAGAILRTEPLQGKGNVVRRMFADVEADAYVLVDGDATYDAADSPKMLQRLFDERLDMVIGSRVTDGRIAYRYGHRWGNKMLAGLVSRLFGAEVGDMLSGYRVFSRRFVKCFPAVASGFETETELTVHALQLRMPVASIRTSYAARPEGSASKLSTYKDGLRILLMIIALVKGERPLAFYGTGALLFGGLSLGLGIPVVLEFLRTGLVPRFPTAFLAASLMVLAFLSLASGLVLEQVTRARHEMKRLRYLELSSAHELRFPGAGDGSP